MSSLRRNRQKVDKMEMAKTTNAALVSPDEICFVFIKIFV